MVKQNNILRSVRIQKSWTPEFVSKQVGVSRGTYTRWEAGTQVPRLSSLHALCKVFEMSPAELGFVNLSTTNGTNRDNVTKEPAPEELAAVDEIQDEPVDLSASLAHWSTGLASCWQWYMAGGQAELERLVPAYLAHLARPTLMPGPDQRAAASLTSQVYQLIAVLAMQRCDFSSAQSNGTQAVVYAQLAKDWNMYVAAQLRLATIFSARKHVGSALIAYNDALRRITSENDAISPVLHSWIFAGLAEIQATMGREAEALQFLKLAMAVFPPQLELTAHLSYASCDRSMLYLYQGLVFLRLGQPKLAWEAFSQVDELRPPPPERIRADFLKYKAYTSLALGNMIQSCIYLEAAARAALAINSELIFGDIYDIYEHILALWGQEPRVRALAMLFQK
ncbi:MAG: helix-turn-helix transcriptional regulator [Ktedonobacteraceae bacterium]|nr:helix-turn-helix transcriptional regulator [Ktedonobacteraceae bacterium]